MANRQVSLRPYHKGLSLEFIRWQMNYIRKKTLKVNDDTARNHKIYDFVPKNASHVLPDKYLTTSTSTFTRLVERTRSFQLLSTVRTEDAESADGQPDEPTDPLQELQTGGRRHAQEQIQQKQTQNINLSCPQRWTVPIRLSPFGSIAAEK